MKIKIFPEKCIACGLCHLYAPEVFDYDDAGIVRFYEDKCENENEAATEHFGKQDENLSKAIKHCPTGAIAKI
ncbi:ferredoxin [Lactovum odontotermitis]